MLNQQMDEGWGDGESRIGWAALHDAAALPLVGPYNRIAGGWLYHGTPC